jgi:hypothetical protein
MLYRTTIASAILLAYHAIASNAFTPIIVTPKHTTKTALSQQPKGEGEKGSSPFGFVSNFFSELDAFVDDATNRRLGNGAAFYGKRKSAFYGEGDLQKKIDRNASDPTEDYQGPKTAGYFQWMPDEDGQMRPVTRLKKKNIERNPGFWDKAFSDDE